MLDECLTELARCVHPVGIRWEEHATRADAIGLRILDTWWHGAALHVRLDGGNQATADADDHGVGGAQVLQRAIVNVAHAGGHGGVLHTDAVDAGEAGRAGVGALDLAVHEEIVGPLLLWTKAAVPVGGVWLLGHSDRERTCTTGPVASAHHAEGHGVRVVHWHARVAAFLGAKYARWSEAVEGETPLGDAPVHLVIGCWATSTVGGAGLGIDDLEMGGFHA